MAKNVPAEWLAMMEAADKRTGLPPGTTYGIIKTETGFHDRFIADPSAAHYLGPNPKSSAAGLGGILKGTATNPGYGVAPLKDWSAPEQIRFIADYAAARVKSAGSVEAGLAGYGEGSQYAKKVMASTPNSRNQQVITPTKAGGTQPVLLAKTEVPSLPVVDKTPVEQVMQSTPVEQVAQVAEPVPEEWQQFQERMPQQMQAEDLQFGNPGFSLPQIDTRAYALNAPKIDFSAFKRVRGRV